MALATMNNAQFQSILDSYQLHCEISSLRLQCPLDLVFKYVLLVHDQS